MNSVLQERVPPELDLEEGLKSALMLFGFKQFSPKQDELIRASIQGQDVLGVLRTGSGKSACFQVPGIITRQRTLVVSPLIALQENQVRALRNIGVKAWAFHSNMDDVRKQAVHHYYKVASKDEPSFLYISPELLMTEMFHQRFDHVGFDRLAVDEAHCVSTWGDSFRPDYQRIRVASKRLRIPHCSAYTATVDKKIEADIRKRIPLRPDFLKVTEDPYRENLLVRVEPPDYRPRHRLYQMTQLLRHPEYNGPAIVYYNSIDGVVRLYLKIREMANFCAETGYTPYLFHAGLPYEDKQAALHGFLNDRKPLVFATSAFGMGMDRPDIRQIIHYRTPKQLIEYAQQIGRGGRDGLPTLCTTFHSPWESDEWHAEWQLERAKLDAPNYDFVERQLENLRRTLARMTDQKKRRRYNISAFKNWMVKAIKENERIENKRAYEARFLASMAILQRVGLVVETGDGLAVHKIVPSGKHHLKLLELTKMHERMLVREQERIHRYFSAKEPNQAFLWEILSEEESKKPKAA